MYGISLCITKQDKLIEERKVVVCNVRQLSYFALGIAKKTHKWDIGYTICNDLFMYIWTTAIPQLLIVKLFTNEMNSTSKYLLVKFGVQVKQEKWFQREWIEVQENFILMKDGIMIDG